MPLAASAPWHRESFDRFLNEGLPQLLASRVPLAGYRVEPTGTYACRVAVALDGPAGPVELEFADLPRPDADGLFALGGTRRVVVPLASSDALDAAEIRCVGEQLLAYVDERLGEAPAGLPWDDSVASAWLPLAAWITEFLATTAQVVDGLNWLSERTHLRRLVVPDRRKLIAPGHFGRVCPFETPEGPNIGRVLSIALGAAIRDGRLVVVDGRPEAALGLAASMLPLLEHSDANRVLMGLNMMRQQLVPPDPEPALVQTGNEPDAPAFWCGRNLLTAFVSWGIETFEDAILLSESCARKLDFPHPVEPGDKLANRHGSKGTVGRIVADDRMPHLADGTPVELVYNFIGCHTRLNFGQLREAVLGRIARAEGRPAIVPPFHAPSADDLRQRLRDAGLPDSGMETLRLGRDGEPLDRPSTVGWVYWGKLSHLARAKLHAVAGPTWAVPSDAFQGQRQGELEYYALRDLGAFENLAEAHNTRSAERPDADTLAERVAAGPVQQAPPPTPAFAELARRLAVAGILVALDDGRLAFRFATPEECGLRLARPVPHPWLRDRELAAIGPAGQLGRLTAEGRDGAQAPADGGALTECPEYRAVVEANARLERMMAGRAPESLQQRTLADLEARVADLFAVQLPPGQPRGGPRLAFGDLERPTPYWGLGNRVLFSGRAVISPAFDLSLEQVGLADDLAWTLFGPLVVREVGCEDEVRARTGRAAQALDALMARSWVLVNRAPTVLPTSILAFRPVRCPGSVIRLHPLACPLLNADFDGDQAAVFLPLTDGAQREAGERLSVAAHLARDPELLKWLLPTQDMLWGLAALSRTPEGLAEIAHLAGTPVAAPDGFVTKSSLLEALRAVLEREGVAGALAALERLMHRGVQAARRSGASMSPFIGASLDVPTPPQSDDPGAWNAYAEELADRLAARTDYDDADLGPQLLAVKTAARGSLRQLLWLVGPRGAVVDATDALVPSRRGLREGLTPRESFLLVVGARRGLGRTVVECTRTAYGIREAAAPKGFNVLARALRASRPGAVFARAAATGEIDPLRDLDSRLFVGLPPARPRGSP